MKGKYEKSERHLIYFRLVYTCLCTISFLDQFRFVLVYLQDLNIHTVQEFEYNHNVKCDESHTN